MILSRHFCTPVQINFYLNYYFYFLFLSKLYFFQLLAQYYCIINYGKSLLKFLPAVTTTRFVVNTSTQPLQKLQYFVNVGTQIPTQHILHLYFYSLKFLLKKTTYLLGGLRTTKTWWTFKSFKSWAWPIGGFVHYYTNSFARFKSLFRRYIYFKPTLRQNIYFPREIKSKLNYSFLIQKEFALRTSFNFLNGGRVGIRTKFPIEWEFDLLYYWKNYSLSKKLKKIYIKNLKVMNIFSSELFYYREKFLYNYSNPTSRVDYFYQNNNYYYNLDSKFFLIRSKKRKIIIKKLKFITKLVTPYKIFSKYRLYLQKIAVSNLLHVRFEVYNSLHTILPRLFIPKLRVARKSLNSRRPSSKIFRLRLCSAWGAPFISNFGSFAYLSPSRSIKTLSCITIAAMKIKSYSFFEKHDLHHMMMRDSVKSQYISAFYSNTATPNRHAYFRFSSITKPLSFLAPLPFFAATFVAIYEKFHWNKKIEHFSQFYDKLTLLYANKINMKIKRIRFKPGYMNYWRTARKEIKNILNLKFRYQNNLTRYFLRFNKFAGHSISAIRTYAVINILYISKLLPHKTIAEDFVRNYFVYINGVCIINPYFQLYKYDILQLIIHLKYYMFYKYLINLLHRDKIFIKKIFYYKTKIISPGKKRFSTIPDKIKTKYHPNEDVPGFLEIDFFSLSVYILYEPVVYGDLNLTHHLTNRFSILRLYNWKYIT